MRERVLVRRGAYHDSVELMALSQELTAGDGVREAVVAMATPLNLQLLRERAFSVPDGLGANDLLIAVRTQDDSATEAVLATIEGRLDGKREPATRGTPGSVPASVRAAAAADGRLSVALVSVPGRHAAAEIVSSLDSGLHVFCFSAGPSVEQEAALKAHARRHGLLLMGPDCGTAILNGVGLGFANAVAPGPVGIVAASGTGAQELVCLLDHRGIGVSHVIGVGGRDLKEPVDAVMTLAALDALAEEPGTAVIAVVSKPPDPGPARAVLEACARIRKPVLPVFLGARPDQDTLGVATTGEAAAERIAELLGVAGPRRAAELRGRPTPGAIRGLFCGASLASQVLAAIGGRVGSVPSNLDGSGGGSLDAMHGVAGHAVIDFGDEGLTDGRPHPMIDPTLRDSRVALAMEDPRVGVVVADVVLGSGTHPDPAASLAPVIEAGLERRPGAVTAIVVLCGTRGDPQDVESQEARLTRAGAVVVESAAAAGRLALEASGA